MKIRRFYGKDMREALRLVKEELGGEAVIMSSKKVADGIELVAAYDKEPEPTLTHQLPVAGSATKATPASPKPTPSLSEIIGDSGPDSLRALLEKQHAAQTAAHNEPASHNSAHSATQAGEPMLTAEPRNSQYNAAPAESVASASHATNDKAMDEIRQELKSLRNVLQFQVSGLMEQESRRGHPMRSYLVSRLQQMGISPDLAEEVVSYTPEEADERAAWLYLLRLLANRMSIDGQDILQQSGVVALLGATGSGKTTTVAKLAARYAQKYGADQVGLVTIDSYRIAAYEQLATYGKIIGCAVKKAHSSEELADVLHQFRNKRLILIDTAGFGQRDARLIKQLHTFEQVIGIPIKKYLCLQANAQYQVMQRTINTYNAISLHGCIFTKLDECYSLGEAISVAIENKLPISYITDGQRVPEDMKVAEAKYLISTAAKLYKKYSIQNNHEVSAVKSALAI